MSFRKNDCQQVTFDDSFFSLTAREQKALKNSWAEVFANEIFPAIDEDKFSVLYSDKGSHPNTPVNVIVGAMIIKELFDYSDDELVEALMLDLRLQYALHTTSCPEQPLSDKTLSRFRKRCYDYESLTGEDLYHECIVGLSDSIAKTMNISGSVRRMDSMMIEANIKKFSRMELLYKCISKMAVAVSKKDEQLLPDDWKHYTDPNDFNKVIYHQRSTDSEERLQQLITDGESMLETYRDCFFGSTEYDLLLRCFSEQTIVDEGKRRLRGKEDGGMNSSILQNPSDPEATYRKKSGKEHRGYVANVEESVGENGSVISDYQYEPNNYSDEQFFKGRLGQMDEQEEPVTMVADAAYGSAENVAMAKEKNVELVTTSLTGKTPEEIAAGFEFSDDGTRILRCPAGYKPKSCDYQPSNQQISASFLREQCETCPHREECKARICKKIARIHISKKTKQRAEAVKSMKSERFQALARLRNGIETVPSTLRRKYHMNNLPRGKQRGKFAYGSKVGAFYVMKLFTFRRGRGKYAPNPMIS